MLKFKQVMKSKAMVSKYPPMTFFHSITPISQISDFEIKPETQNDCLALLKGQSFLFLQGGYEQGCLFG